MRKLSSENRKFFKKFKKSVFDLNSSGLRRSKGGGGSKIKSKVGKGSEVAKDLTSPRSIMFSGQPSSRSGGDQIESTRYGVFEVRSKFSRSHSAPPSLSRPKTSALPSFNRDQVAAFYTQMDPGYESCKNQILFIKSEYDRLKKDYFLELDGEREITLQSKEVETLLDNLAFQIEKVEKGEMETTLRRDGIIALNNQVVVFFQRLGKETDLKKMNFFRKEDVKIKDEMKPNVKSAKDNQSWEDIRNKVINLTKRSSDYTDNQRKLLNILKKWTDINLDEFGEYVYVEAKQFSDKERTPWVKSQRYTSVPLDHIYKKYNILFDNIEITRMKNLFI